MMRNESQGSLMSGPSQFVSQMGLRSPSHASMLPTERRNASPSRRIVNDASAVIGRKN